MIPEKPVLEFKIGSLTNTFQFGKHETRVVYEAYCGETQVEGKTNEYQSEYSAVIQKNGRNYFAASKPDISCPALTLEIVGNGEMFGTFTITAKNSPFDVLFLKENVGFEKNPTNNPEVAGAGMATSLYNFVVIGLPVIFGVCGFIGLGVGF
uniref:Uncharacterized protein n=1 Tax=Panagrolaimus sp. JU765 TaxID=591449 RepID=A0AC34QW74_9BILA